MTIQITEAARKKIKEILAGEEWKDKSTYLRVGITGGGCSGLSYKLELCDKSQRPIDEKHDKIFQFPEIKVVVDRKSYLYLNGTTLDYVTQGLTGGFTFINPKAKGTCGCGTSFSPE